MVDIENPKLSVCLFSSLSKMMNYKYTETDLYFLSKDYKIKYYCQGDVPRFALRAEDCINNINAQLNSKIVSKKFTSLSELKKDCRNAVSIGPVVLHVKTGNLKYSDIYQKNRSGNHYINLTGLLNEDMILIEDNHIRNGTKLEQFIGAISLDSIRMDIIDYIFILDSQSKSIDRLKIIKEYFIHCENTIYNLNNYLDLIVQNLTNTQNQENDYLENYVHLSVYSGTHYWNYLYNMLISLKSNQLFDIAELNHVLTQVKLWDALKYKLMKSFYVKNQSDVLNHIDLLKKSNIKMLVYLHQLEKKISTNC